MKEIRIRGVVEEISNELHTIAKKHEGVNLSDFLKPKLRVIINDYYSENPNKLREE